MANQVPQYKGSLRKKRWVAKAKRDGLEYYLGHFLTKEEAIAAERDFDASDPSKRQRPSHANAL